MSASMRAPGGFTANEMGSNLPQMLQHVNIKGYHDFLIGRLQ